jgi:competence protein ComFA
MGVGIEEGYVCPRCGNRDPRFLGINKGQIYCRKCIAFVGAKAAQLPSVPKEVRLSLKYSLSKEQKALSDHIVSNFRQGIDTLVYAVCGSGKTEISYGIISYAMEHGLSVGFALPRRDVAIELFFRLKDAFPDNRIVAVYGEHTSRLTGDVVILTTHQLYRYPHYFDLLVMDEIDAFPFKGNEVLIAMYKASLRGHCVMMSATPSKEIMAEFKKDKHDIVELRTRFHKHPIPVPVIYERPSFWQPIFVIKKLHEYKRKGKPCFVFVPSISKSEELYHFLSVFVKGGNYVNSQREGREKIIESFKEGHLRYLVTTSVLERGVTIKDLQVLVVAADTTRIYTSATLIQIAGRAGRKSDAPDGEVTFLGEKSTKSMQDAVKEIGFCNTFL